MEIYEKITNDKELMTFIKVLKQNLLNGLRENKSLSSNNMNLLLTTQEICLLTNISNSLEILYEQIFAIRDSLDAMRHD